MQYFTLARSGRHITILISAIALPLPLLSACAPSRLSPEVTMALAPLAVACSGQPVAEATDYDPKNPTPPMVAMVADNGNFVADALYLDAKAKQATAVKETQLVLCVVPEKPELIETCRYSGSGSYEIPRFSQKVGLKLVSAKTGKVLAEANPTAEAKPCSESLTTREGSTPNTAPLTAEIPLMDLVQSWSLTAIASTAPAVNVSPATGGSSSTQGASNSSTPKEQCKALETLTKSDFGYGSKAQIAVQSRANQIKDPNNDIQLRVANNMGKQSMAEHLPAVAKAIAQGEALSLSDIALQTIRDRFLVGLKGMEKDLKAFDGLVKESATAIENQPIDRQKVQEINPKMQKIANDLTKQSKELSEITINVSVLCSTIK